MWRFLLETKTSNQDFRRLIIKEFYNQEAITTQTLTYSIKIRIHKRSSSQTSKQMGKKAPGDRWCVGPASASITPGDARSEIAHHQKWLRKMQGLACPLGYTPIHTPLSWMEAQTVLNNLLLFFIIFLRLFAFQKMRDKGSGEKEKRG